MRGVFAQALDIAKLWLGLDNVYRLLKIQVNTFHVSCHLNISKPHSMTTNHSSYKHGSHTHHEQPKTNTHFMDS